jgi:hypothetical protein
MRADCRSVQILRSKQSFIIFFDPLPSIARNVGGSCMDGMDGLLVAVKTAGAKSHISLF